MTTAPGAMLTAALAILGLMIVAWLVSVIIKDVSIVDIVWGLGFVLVAWVVHSRADGNDGRRWLLTILTTVWGLRLSGYLAKRNLGHGEDYRYRAMRKHYGPKFPIISFFTVFLLQGTLMFIVSLPVQLGQVRRTPDVGVVGYLGGLVWLIGLGFESIGDLQLARFKAKPESAGKVMDQGLWRYTRHPNYFGDACVWFGLAIIAAESGIGAIGFVGAIAMTILLRRVSGVVMLEKTIGKRRAGYADYIKRTSPFIPLPPKKI